MCVKSQICYMLSLTGEIFYLHSLVHLSYFQSTVNGPINEAKQFQFILCLHIGGSPSNLLSDQFKKGKLVTPNNSIKRSNSCHTLSPLVISSQSSSSSIEGM